MNQVVCHDVMVEAQTDEVLVDIGRIDFDEFRVGFVCCIFPLLGKRSC